MGRPLDEDIIIKILERWQKAFKENSHYISASDLSLVIKDVRELPTIQPEKAQLSKEGTTSDLISRQQAIDALDCINGTEEVLRSLPSAQPEYEEVALEEAASEIASGNMMSAWSWFKVIIQLKQMGYAICRKR